MATPGAGAVGSVVDRWDLGSPVEQVGDERSNLFVLRPGRIVELSGEPGGGLTRLGYRMLVEPSRRSPVVVVDVRGWMSPASAWEVGVEPHRLIVVRCSAVRSWLQVMAVLCEGVRAMVAEVPTGIRDHDLRRVAALVRSRRVGLALRPLEGSLPPGVAHLRVHGRGSAWSGPDRGHGRLQTRRILFEVSGKGAGGVMRQMEVEESDANDVRVVPGLVVEEAGRAG